MRVMVIVKATKNSEAGVMPAEALLAAMGRYNEELVKAGVMLAGDGLHPSDKGKRVVFGEGRKTVVDGPFAETKELIAGFTLIETRDLDEALEWVRRWPEPNVELELRRVYEIEDFGDAVPQDVVEQEARIRENTGAFGDR